MTDMTTTDNLQALRNFTDYHLKLGAITLREAEVIRDILANENNLSAFLMIFAIFSAGNPSLANMVSIQTARLLLTLGEEKIIAIGLGLKK